MPFRSPRQTSDSPSAWARGTAGAALVAAMLGAGVVVAPVIGRWLDGGEIPPASQAVVPPRASAPALPPVRVATPKPHVHRKHVAHAKRAHRSVVVAGDVVVGTAEGSVILTPPASDAARTPAPAKPPVAPKPARRPRTEVTATSGIPVVATPPPVPVAAAPTGLVRLNVQSVGIAPNSSGDPELQAKFGIEGAPASAALPDTVTVHLRPQLPAQEASESDPMALRTTVDMVDAPRAAPTDPALRLRVQMTVAPASSAPPTPVVEDPGPADGKSNVIAMTVALSSFERQPADGGSTPPDEGGSTPPDEGGTTPPDPGGTTPPDPGGTTPPDPGGTTPPDPGGTTPPDPGGTTPPDPGGSTPPDQPAPGGGTTTPPTPPDQPAGTPAPAPAGVILPVGQLPPSTGTTTVPLPTEGGALPGPLPVVVIVEELPPDAPPADPAAGTPTPAVQDPALEVPAPPADATANPDPGATAGTAADPAVPPADGSLTPVAAETPPAGSPTS